MQEGKGVTAVVAAGAFAGLMSLALVTGCSSFEYEYYQRWSIGEKVTCAKPIWLDHYEILAPCGKCPSCLKNRAREWAVRLQHEAPYWGASSFITLTYDQENFRLFVSKKELQNFFKRLRYHMELLDRKIAYFACGEYGSQGRAHYHAIVFGLAVREKFIVEEAWDKGLVHIGDFSPASARYVVNYMQKQINGAGQFKPFRIMSKGIGTRWASEHAERLRRDLGFTVNGTKVPLPKAYAKIAEVDPEKLREKNAELRQEIAEEMKANGLTHANRLDTIAYRNNVITKKIRLFERR